MVKTNKDRFLALLRSHWQIVFFIFFALLLSFEYWGFGADSYVRVFDSADGRLATRIALRNNLLGGEVGYWNWDMFGGLDRLAEGNSLEFINILFYALPGWLAYGIFMFLQRFIAGIFTYKLLNKHLGVRRIVALFPAMFYALWSQSRFNNSQEGFTVPNSFSLAGIPMVLFFFGEISKQYLTDKRKALLLTGAFGFVFAGMTNFAFSIFIFMLIPLWLVLLVKQNIRVTLTLFSAFIVGWLAIEGWELWAAWLQGPSSHRNLRETCVALGGVGFRQIVSAQFRTYNFPLLVLGFAGLLFYRKTIAYQNALIALSLLAFFDMASDFLPQLFCSSINPFEFLTGFNTKRVIRYTPFFISIFAGVSFESFISWLEDYGIGQLRLFSYYFTRISVAAFIFWIGLISIEAKIETLELRQQGFNYRSIFENPYLVYVANMVDEQPFTRAAMVYHNPSQPRPHPGFLWPYGINSIDGYTTIHPVEFSEMWSAVINPMMLRYKYCRYGRSMKNGDNRIYLSTECDVGLQDDELPLDRWFDQELLSLLGTRYFISEHPVVHENLREVNLSTINCDEKTLGCTKYHVYENTNVYPPFFNRSQVIALPEGEKILNQLRQSESTLPSQNVFMLTESVKGFTPIDLAPSAIHYEILDFGFDKISIHVVTESPQIFILNSTYSPYWRLAVNRVEGDLFPAYHVLTGFYLPAGSHDVVLTYEPPYSFLTYYFRAARLLDR
jgi:hypothetical protein